MASIRERKTLKCPDCSGIMYLKSGGVNYYSYVCDICSALLMTQITEKPGQIQIGSTTVGVTSQVVLNILKNIFGDKK